MSVALKTLILMAWLIGMPASWAWADEVPPPPPSTKSALKFAAESERLFQHYCAHCHGTHGEGDGYNSEFLEKDPADLTDIEFVSKKTNDQIFRTIHQGGAGIRKSHLMPVFGNTLSEEEIWGLVAHIRKLAGDDSHPLTLPLGVMKKARPEPISLTRGHVKAFLQWFLKEKSKDELVSWGRRLFEEKKSCFACHRVGDEGGKVGPDLTRAGFDYKPEWLFAWVQNPQNMKKKTKMPNLGLRTDEAIAITAFLSTLKGEVSEIPEEWAPYMETTGDPKRGEALFYDPDGKANCVKCHWILGKGGKVGANLSMVGSSRTLPFLLESILDPTAVITVGFSSMMVLTKEKKFITGIKKGEDDSSLTIFTKEGTLITIPKERIKKFKVQKLSMMPSNYKDILTVREIQDLLAYLNTLQPPILKNLGSPELDSEEEEERAIDIQLLRKEDGGPVASKESTRGERGEGPSRSDNKE